MLFKPCCLVVFAMLCLPLPNTLVAQTSAPPKMNGNGQATLQSKLAAKAKLLYIDVPLSAVLVDVAKKHGISVKIAEAALKANPETSALKVNCETSNVPLRSALRLLLSTHGLDYVVGDRGILVTTTADARNRPRVLRVFMPDRIAKHQTAFVNAVQETILTDASFGSIKIEGNELVVSARKAVLGELQSLIHQIPHGTELNAAEARIRKMLQKRDNLTVLGSSVEDVMSEVYHKHSLPIVVDTRAIKAAGLSPDAVVTFRIEDVPLSDSLRYILHQADLSYVIDDEVLKVTTKKIADQHQRVVAYKFPPAAVPHMHKIREMLITRTQNLWTNNRVGFFHDQLIVYGSYHAHEVTESYSQSIIKRFESMRADPKP